MNLDSLVAQQVMYETKTSYLYHREQSDIRLVTCFEVSKKCEVVELPRHQQKSWIHVLCSLLSIRTIQKT